MARLAEDDELREREKRAAGRGGREPELRAVAGELDELYAASPARRRAAARERTRSPTGLDRRRPAHAHDAGRTTARSRSRDLLDHAEAEGLGAIAITDHNAFGGALEAVELARDRELVVIPGEEVKTDGQGEVIGLFLERRDPARPVLRRHDRGDPRAGRARLPPASLRPHARDSRCGDAAPPPRRDRRLEVYNARLLFETYNDEALRFARKYNLIDGRRLGRARAPGGRHGACACARFDGPEEFLLSLRSAEVLRRPKSLAYLQSLKWVAQVKEKVR